jgi:hypothetical protein
MSRTQIEFPIEKRNAQGEDLTVSQRKHFSETLAIAIEFWSDGVGYESGNSENHTIN